MRWGSPQLSPDGRTAVVSVRSADNTERWLAAINPANGTTKILDRIKDDAWVRDGGQGWLPDNKRVWFLAEHDGWMHLYTVDATTGDRKQLTSGKFELDSVELSQDGRTFFFQSNEAHPGEQHLYSMSVDGGPRTRITADVGGHQGTLSPDNSTFGLVSSSMNRPPEVFVKANRADAKPIRVTTSPSKEWMSHKWVEPQLVTYKARDGAEVYARLYTPEMVGAKRDPKAPAVIFVHGAGYAQNAHKFWSSYYREYMFHHLLAARGYVVLDPDYRASAGYGRDWRTSIYRWMGGHDLNDVVDGVAYLAKSHKVDAKRVGVYGGSYGGFITLMALFTAPDAFAAGAALRPGHRLGALQPSIHLEHPQRAAGGRRGVPQELADLLCGRAEGAAADCARHGGRQRALPGLGAAGAAADRTAQGELGARGVSGRGSRLRRSGELGGRVQTDPQAVRNALEEMTN